MDAEMQRRDPDWRGRQFRALCRSSPWRWETIRFEIVGRITSAERAAGPTAPGASPEPAASARPVPVRAWFRRPNALRVESVDGTLLQITTNLNESRDEFYISSSRKSWLLQPRLVSPVYDDDQLVARRPEADYSMPIFGSPRWAAVLDPVELAGNAPVPFETPYANRVQIETVEPLEVAGRRSLRAVVVPGHTYRPLVDGYPLIRPGRTAVTIDWETGVCVAAEALDGAEPGAGHELRILGLDEYLIDDLFTGQDYGLSDVRAHPPYRI